MFNFTKKLMLAKLMELGEGEIKLMGTPVSIVPLSILADIQKDMIKATGYKKAYEKIYDGSVEGSKSYNRSYIRKYGIKDMHELLKLQTEILTSAGWGKVSFDEIDIHRKVAELRIENSPFVKEYGKSKTPVCIIQAGFVAGALSLVFEDHIMCFETQCKAQQGHTHCEFVIGPRNRINKKRDEQWKKLGVNKKA
jgi:predicted hydrocarbon binding protein